MAVTLCAVIEDTVRAACRLEAGMAEMPLSHARSTGAKSDGEVAFVHDLRVPA